MVVMVFITSMTTGRGAVLLLLSALLLAPADSAAPTVTVGALGTVTGAASPLAPSVGVYKGIPYAKPPVGADRWKPPMPHGPFGDLDGTAFGSICAQHAGVLNVGSEDCLFLNVGAPLARASLLPVLVWIHGGSYVSGASNLYDPAPLVAASPCF